MRKHLQVLFDEKFQCVFVLEDDFNVDAENVVAVCVLPAEIAEGRSRQANQMKCWWRHAKKTTTQAWCAEKSFQNHLCPYWFYLSFLTEAWRSLTQQRFSLHDITKLAREVKHNKGPLWHHHVLECELKARTMQEYRDRGGHCYLTTAWLTNSQAQVSRLSSVHLFLWPDHLDLLVKAPVILQEGADMALVMGFLQQARKKKVGEFLSNPTLVGKPLRTRLSCLPCCWWRVWSCSWDTGASAVARRRRWRTGWAAGWRLPAPPQGVRSPAAHRQASCHRPVSQSPEYMAVAGEQTFRAASGRSCSWHAVHPPSKVQVLGM